MQAVVTRLNAESCLEVLRVLSHERFQYLFKPIILAKTQRKQVYSLTGIAGVVDGCRFTAGMNAQLPIQSLRRLAEYDLSNRQRGACDQPEKDNG